MGVTIVGGDEVTYPRTALSPLVQIKHEWADDWETEEALEFLAADCHTAGQDLSRAKFRWRYSEKVMHPHESDFAEREARDLAGWWVRVRLIDGEDEEETTIFIGRFSSEDREVHGTTSHGPSGIQTLVAYGPLHILQRIDVHTSVWMDDSTEKVIGWLPPINKTTERRGVIGNRSGNFGSKGEYLYDGKGSYHWTYRQYLGYLLAYFVDTSDDGGPAWSIGGQSALLNDMSEPIQLSGVESVANIINRLIPKRLGVDWKIVPKAADDDEEGNEEGFEIQVFALNAHEVSFGDKTLPKNPNTVEIETDETLDYPQVRVAISHDQEYDTIRVVGRRIVAGCSLRGANALSSSIHGATLVPGWLPNLQADYDAGMPNEDDEEANDLYRNQDRFRPVYQTYVAPHNWGDVFYPRPDPKTTKDGELSTQPATYQNTMRGTLSWLPLREGTDYSTDPPTEEHDGDMQPDLLPPAVWVRATVTPDSVWWEPEMGDGSGDEAHFVPVDKLGIGVSVLRSEWGVHLSASPNHLLANNHLSVEGDGIKGSENPPLYDYDDLIATIAIETDHRLTIEKAIPDALPTGGIKTIEVPDAEMWVLAPHTVLTADPESRHGYRTSGPSLRVLRNDVERLRMIMCGALARYWHERSRVSITHAGLRAYTDLLGHILTTIDGDEGDLAQRIYAPVSTVSYRAEGNNVVTLIRAGHAR